LPLAWQNTGGGHVGDQAAFGQQASCPVRIISVRRSINLYIKVESTPFDGRRPWPPAPGGMNKQRSPLADRFFRIFTEPFRRMSAEYPLRGC
jgi:hypothetical protein